VLAAIMPLAAAAGTPIPGWQLSPHLQSMTESCVSTLPPCHKLTLAEQQLPESVVRQAHRYRPGSGVPAPGKLPVLADIAGPYVPLYRLRSSLCGGAGVTHASAMRQLRYQSQDTHTEAAGACPI
jgi:hypothetical protein